MADASTAGWMQAAISGLEARMTALETEVQALRKEITLLAERALPQASSAPVETAFEGPHRYEENPTGGARVSEQERQAEIRHAGFERRREARRAQQVVGEREDEDEDVPAA